jgi:hypothetical protein
VEWKWVANVPPTLEFRRWNNGKLLWSHPIGDWYRQKIGAPFVTSTAVHFSTCLQVPSPRVNPFESSVDRSLRRARRRAPAV